MNDEEKKKKKLISAFYSVFSGWDPNDKGIIKGLALFGPESKIFQKAPKECQERALECIKKGWKPKNKDMANALTDGQHEEECPY